MQITGLATDPHHTGHIYTLLCMSRASQLFVDNCSPTIVYLTKAHRHRSNFQLTGTQHNRTTKVREGCQ